MFHLIICFLVKCYRTRSKIIIYYYGFKKLNCSLTMKMEKRNLTPVDMTKTWWSILSGTSCRRIPTFTGKHTHWVLNIINKHTHWVLNIITKHTHWVLNIINKHTHWVLNIITKHTHWVLKHTHWVLNIINKHTHCVLNIYNY